MRVWIHYTSMTITTILGNLWRWGYRECVSTGYRTRLSRF